MKCPPTTLKKKMIGFKDIFAVRTKGKRLSILNKEKNSGLDILLSLEFFKFLF
jgi:hypothetical protein